MVYIHRADQIDVSCVMQTTSFCSAGLTASVLTKWSYCFIPRMNMFYPSQNDILKAWVAQISFILFRMKFSIHVKYNKAEKNLFFFLELTILSYQQWIIVLFYWECKKLSLVQAWILLPYWRVIFVGLHKINSLFLSQIYFFSLAEN